MLSNFGCVLLFLPSYNISYCSMYDPLLFCLALMILWAFMGYHSIQNQSVLAKAKVSHIRKTHGSLYPHETQIPTSINVSNQIKLKQPSRFFCKNQDAENIPGSSAVNSQMAKAFQTSDLCRASQSHTHAGTG